MIDIFPYDPSISSDVPSAVEEGMAESASSAEGEDVFALPASFAQQRLWFLEQWEPGVYNITQSVGLNGRLNIAVMERAFREIIRRHEALRTSFRMGDDNSLLQIIHPEVPFALTTVDLCAFPEDVRKIKARRMIKDEMRRPFDLLTPSLLRMTILQVGEENHILLLAMHHIISDAWSLEVLFSELRVLYAAYIFDRPSPLPELALQYADYAIWQRECLQGEPLEVQLHYWREQLSDLAVLQLPLDHPRPAVQTFRGAVKDVTIPARLTMGLNALSRRTGVTLFMTLLAAFKTLLYRYSGQTNIVVGSPIAGRTESQLEALIGCFINTLVLRTDLSGNPTFTELLARVREVALSAYEHQDIPFEKLVEELQPDRDLSHNPLTQVMFALQNVPQDEASLSGVALIPLHNIEQAMFKSVGTEQQVSGPHRPMDENKTAMFDLDLTVWEKAGALFVEIKYNTDLFEPATIDRFQEHFVTLLSSIVSDPTQRIAHMPFVSLAEQHLLTLDWNRTQRPYPPPQHSYARLFSEQVRRTPHKIAVEYENVRLTYAELDKMAASLASHLRERGVGAEDIVALADERGPQLLASILAVFKVGAAYLPLDLRHPPARLRTVLTQSHCRLVISREAFQPVLMAVQSELAQPISMLFADTLPLREQVSSDDAPYRPRNLAYVIYTSGSTGLPKGVMVEQHGMLNHIYAKIDALQLSGDDCVAQTASHCFDISVWQFLAALLVGGCVRIYPDAIAYDPSRLLDSVEQDRITVLETVPSLMRALLENQDDAAQRNRPALQALRWLIPTGEALPVELCQRWSGLYPRVPLLNAYGPTECSDDVTHYVIDRPLEPHISVVPIGVPVNNMRLYVLDGQLQPQPIGIAGEIYVGGIGVGRGYLGNPGRTAETFVPDRFADNEGGRLYKTGDLGRFLSDGNLEFLGRVDDQVKVRGNRIELGEIEKVLDRHPAVQACTVQACTVQVREDTTGQQRLIAYVVSLSQQIDVDALQHHLREHLPEYMVPSAFVLLDSLPLTSNGKLDKKALPAPGNTRVLASPICYVAPRDAIEEQLATIWSDVLGVTQVGVHDDFFALGGHSLLTVRLVKLIEQEFGQRIPLAAIFQRRTVESLAELLRDLNSATSPTAAFDLQVQPADLLADAQLDLDTCHEIWSPERRTAYAHILLTGATGFVGTFLLAELLLQTSATVYCLIRASNESQGMQKIQTLMESALVWQADFAPRIKPIIGDLAQPLLGLSEYEFNALAETLDVIYHNGAFVNTIYPYSEMRGPNVEGTRQIIRLAAHGKIKPLHYVSTLSVFPYKGQAPIQYVTEQEPLDEYHAYVQDGYAQSKWVAEKLVSVARSRGLPVVIYRPGRITGHSQTGAWRSYDLLCQMIRGCIQMGSSPIFAPEDILEMTPVDYVSRSIVALSRRRTSPGQAFHLLNPLTAPVNDVISWLDRAGYPIQRLEYAAWLKMLERSATNGQENILTPMLSLFPDADQVGKQEKKRVPRKVMYEQSHTMAALKASAITCPPADESLLHTYLSYMVRTGLLQAPNVHM